MGGPCVRPARFIERLQTSLCAKKRGENSPSWKQDGLRRVGMAMMPIDGPDPDWLGSWAAVMDMSMMALPS